MGLLNNGTLICGRELSRNCCNCGWIPWNITAVCEKKGITKAKGASIDESVESKNSFSIVIDYHPNSFLNLLRFHQFGSTALPGTLLEYVYAEKNLERSPCGGRPSAGGRNRRVKIPR